MPFLVKILLRIWNSNLIWRHYLVPRTYVDCHIQIKWVFVITKLPFLYFVSLPHAGCYININLPSKLALFHAPSQITHIVSPTSTFKIAVCRQLWLVSWDIQQLINVSWCELMFHHFSLKCFQWTKVGPRKVTYRWTMYLHPTVGQWRTAKRRA